jgi:hypothetical protein
MEGHEGRNPSLAPAPARRPPRAFLRRPRRARPAVSHPGDERPAPHVPVAQDVQRDAGQIHAEAARCGAHAHSRRHAHCSRGHSHIQQRTRPDSPAAGGAGGAPEALHPAADVPVGADPAAGADGGDSSGGYAQMRPAGRPASLLSLAGFRNRARDRAAARPGRGPAAGGDSICTKMFVVGLAVAIVFFTPSTSCDRPLRPWLLVFAAGLASYVGCVRGLVLALRPRHQELLETLAYAVYLHMYPLSFTWLVTGSVFVFRGFSSDCDSSILHILSIVICLISILYVALLAIFVSCATALSCCLSPASTARGLSNVMRNRLPNAAPASALRSLQPLTYDPDDAAHPGLAGLADSVCAICLDPYRRGDRVVGLDCEPAVPHFFHNSCIQLWFSRSSSCPLCKRDI